MTDENNDNREQDTDPRALERREFLRKCGKYALVVPPAMTLLLTQSKDASANHRGPTFPNGPNFPNFPLSAFPGPFPFPGPGGPFGPGGPAGP